MDINQAHIDINTLLPSNDSRYFDPTEIDNAINWAVLDLFNQQYKSFGETQRISDALDRYKVTTPVVITGGVGTNPPANIHTLNVVASKLGTTVVLRKTKIVEEQFLAQYLDSEAFGPDETHVVIRFVGNSIQVYPNTFTEIRVTYFRKPILAKWAFTYTGLLQNIPVYDANNSVQIDYSDACYTQVIEKALMFLGVSQKDQTLMAQERLFKQNSIPEVR
jgi:hypothetical protein